METEINFSLQQNTLECVLIFTLVSQIYLPFNVAKNTLNVRLIKDTFVIAKVASPGRDRLSFFFFPVIKYMDKSCLGSW